MYFCAATGSRGGLVAFAAAFMFILVRAPGRVRIGALAASAVMFLLVLAVLPQSMLQRYATLFTSDTDDQEAVESTAGPNSFVEVQYSFHCAASYIWRGARRIFGLRSRFCQE